MISSEIPGHLKEAGVTQELWDACVSISPESAIYYAASPFQGGQGAFTTNATTIDTTTQYFAVDSKYPTAKSPDKNWRALQNLAEEKFKTSGPLLRTVTLKSDLTSGAGFKVYSMVKEINEYIKLLFGHHKNLLYEQCIGWMSRIQVSEVFVLISLDETGFSTIRALEPANIGTGQQPGLFVDPDDVTSTLFYQHYAGTTVELIPDAWCLLDPAGFKEATSRLIASGQGFDPALISTSTKGGGVFSKVGGYRRFVMHWKNLSCIREYLRDTSAVSTALEWLSLYENSQKWKLDNQKALAAYAYVFSWEDTPAGKIGALAWNKMTTEEKLKTGLLSAYTPGSKVFLPPGMKMELKNPSLPSLTGSNLDIFTLAGSGVGIPSDIFVGSTADSSYASIRATRPIFNIEIDNLQHKFEMFMRRLLRVCFAAKMAFGGVFLSLGLQPFRLIPSYEEEWEVEKDSKGVPTDRVVTIKVEPVEKIKFSFPDPGLETDLQSKANMAMGSKHAGLLGMGISPDRLASEFFGVDDYDNERRLNALYEAKYGKLIAGAAVESATEKKFTQQGLDGNVSTQQASGQNNNGNTAPSNGNGNGNGKQPVDAQANP